MPYRRLPNTDQARIRAIQGAINRSNEEPFNAHVLEFNTIYSARNFIAQFESEVSQYHQNTNNRITANREYKHMVNNARMYISHFIQMLNMAIARGDIAPDARSLYGLPVNSSRVPDLTTEEEIYEWGRKVIDGEMKRTNNGFSGYRLQNPPIAIVKVHYDTFCEHRPLHSIHRTTFNRAIDRMTEMRVKADALILDIWNQVENHFRDCKPYEKLCKCKEYGLIYYYRTGEQHLSEATDQALVDEIKQNPTLSFANQTA